MSTSRHEALAGKADEWDVVVRPDRAWWNIELREIWRYRDLLMLMVRRDLLAVYKQTLIGPAWQVLQPLLTSIMFAVVFGIMARMSPSGIPPLLFYLSAVVPWGFFSGVVTRTSQTLLSNAALMTKVYFPRLVAPMATVMATGFNFLVQLTAYFAFALIYAVLGKHPWPVGPEVVMLPVLIVIIAVMGFGVGIGVSALTARFRDFGLLIGFVVQLLMYGSPVIFPLSMTVPGSKIRMALELNPLTPVIEGFRAALLGLPMEWATLWYSAGMAVAALTIGLVLFQRVERSFADVI
ncbi:MAG: ABC transporter permease [Flavobacteriales bacterium]|nr:ABC transporter permease [Flavobacteriales bacterium]